MTNCRTHVCIMDEYYMRLLSLNVRGLRGKLKRISVYEFIKNKQIDICFLQETHCTAEDEITWKNEWGGEILFSNGTNLARGVMILLKPGLDLIVQKVTKDDHGRFIFLEGIYHGVTFRYINIYSPNLQNVQKQFYINLNNQLKTLIPEDEKENLVIGGDFNVIFDPTLDRKGGNFNQTPIYHDIIDQIDGMVNCYNLSDIWRKRNPELMQFTWRQKNPRIYSRLDIWLISDNIQDYVKDVSIKQSIRSDHSAIFLEVDSFATDRGKGYWKLNNSFLDEEKYVSGMIEGLENWSKECEDFEDARIIWEFLKYKIRCFSLDYGKQKNRNKDKTGKELQKKQKYF